MIHSFDAQGRGFLSARKESGALCNAAGGETPPDLLDGWTNCSNRVWRKYGGIMGRLWRMANLKRQGLSTLQNFTCA